MGCRKSTSTPLNMSIYSPSYHLNPTHSDLAMWQSTTFKFVQPYVDMCHDPITQNSANQMVSHHHLPSLSQTRNPSLTFQRRQPLFRHHLHVAEPPWAAIAPHRCWRRWPPRTCIPPWNLQPWTEKHLARNNCNVHAPPQFSLLLPAPTAAVDHHSRAHQIGVAATSPVKKKASPFSHLYAHQILHPREASVVADFEPPCVSHHSFCIYTRTRHRFAKTQPPPSSINLHHGHCRTCSEQHLQLHQRSRADSRACTRSIIISQ